MQPMQGSTPNAGRAVGRGKGNESSVVRSRLVSACIAVLFFVPVGMKLHSHFNLPLRYEIFVGVLVLLAAVVIVAFQMQQEARMKVD